MQTTLKEVGEKVAVVLNIAEQSTQDAIAAAKSAQAQGAHGLMLLPPMRYKATDRETVAYFDEIAKATTLPIMIYNNPVDYKIEVTLDMFDALKGNPNINASHVILQTLPVCEIVLMIVLPFYVGWIP